jgi:hypothetical protein
MQRRSGFRSAKQGVPFTGIYTSVGGGELVAGHLDSVRFGHGLFSLLDAFPFQHPEAPDLSVSIPVGDASGRGAAGRARLFGQGGPTRSYAAVRQILKAWSSGGLAGAEAVMLDVALALHAVADAAQGHAAETTPSR